MAGQKTLLKISGCSVSKAGGVTVDSAKPSFQALINPAGYDHTFSISYAKTKALGQPGTEAKYSFSKPEQLDLKELVLDGTGAVPGRVIAVKTQVEQLRNTVYTYVGTDHEAPIVQLVWGSLIFYGRVQSMVLKYTLFKPNGEPLRAKVTLVLKEFSTIAEIIKEARASSPDLTHMIEVRAGDTLPLLCERIYKDSSYYLEVARINGLTAFRQLAPGSRLRFPPLG